MSITRAGIEAELLAKLKGVLANRFYTLSILANGSNPDLNGPIRRAILFLGGTVAGGLSVADADLAPFEGWDVEKLLDVARLEVLRICLGQCAMVDVQVDENEQKLSQFKDQLLAEIRDAEQLISKPYGPNLSPAVVGRMTGSDMPNDPFLPCTTRTPFRRWPYP